MWDWLRRFFSSDGFMPHVHCYLQDPALTWMHVISDGLIGLAYVAISLTLVSLVRRGRPHIPFHSMFLAFGLFIIACGGTHFMEIWTTWTPTYWVSASVKAVTAIASVVTAIALPPMVPVAIGMIRAAKVSEQRREELEKAHAELSDVYARLKESDELKTRFFANISHELRTPLTLILGPADRLLETPDLPPHRRRELETIQANARALLKHVNDLLDVSALEAGPLRPEYAEVDVARLTRLVAAHFDAFAEERGIRYQVETPERLLAEVDADRVQRVLVNLVSNAFKFTPPGGTIRCSVREAEDRVWIEVGDSGPGIPPELRERVFERFQQVSSGPTREFGGTGLGLSIVKEFVDLHGGGVTVEEAPEGGALFRVRLPRAAPDGAVVQRESRLETATAEASRDAVAELRSLLPDEEHGAETAVSSDAAPTVLVVEDNPEMRRFLSETLSPHYQVATAGNGEEGLRQALVRRPDLVITDVMMPRMSGEELIRAARAHRELDPIPFVVLTAKADDALRAELLEHGAQDYLMKPFSAHELRARVGNLVRMKRTRELLEREVENRRADLDGMAGELAYRKRELQETVASLRVALEQAEHASQVKANFVRMVSHELRTPLTSLQLLLHMLQRNREGTLSPRQQETVRKMGLASQRLVDLIETLLTHARIESGRLSVQPESIELAELARSTVEELRPHAQQKPLQLRSLAPDAPLPLLVNDPRLVRVALVNLIMNALKFTEQGGVDVSTALRNGWHVLEVRDTGPGIPADRLDQIFQPFEQLEGMAHKHTPGVGLGLALVKEIMDALGGKVEVESVPEQGSTFRLLLSSAASADPGDGSR